MWQKTSKVFNFILVCNITNLLAMFASFFLTCFSIIFQYQYFDEVWLYDLIYSLDWVSVLWVLCFNTYLYSYFIKRPIYWVWLLFWTFYGVMIGLSTHAYLDITISILVAISIWFSGLIYVGCYIQTYKDYQKLKNINTVKVVRIRKINIINGSIGIK